MQLGPSWNRLSCFDLPSCCRLANPLVPFSMKIVHRVGMSLHRMLRGWIFVCIIFWIPVILSLSVVSFRRDRRLVLCSDRTVGMMLCGLFWFLLLVTVAWLRISGFADMGLPLRFAIGSAPDQTCPSCLSTYYSIVRSLCLHQTMAHQAGECGSHLRKKPSFPLCHSAHRVESAAPRQRPA